MWRPRSETGPERVFRKLRCDPDVTTRGRFANWWRLLLAVGVIAAPLAVSGGAAAVTGRGPAAPLQAHVHLSRTPALAADKLSALVHHSLQRLPAQMAADVAAGIVALGWFALVLYTRPQGLVARPTAQRRQPRAPPQWTAAVVPFGPALGRAGRFARSRCASFVRTNGRFAC